jgi:hypothetical protein
VAIGPVILISGIGLLLLTMTNRFGRVIDRARQLARDLRTASPVDREAITAQLNILLRRAQIVRAAIALAGLSVLLTALLIVVLFLTALFKLGMASLISAVFIACMVCLVASLGFFIADINISLAALRLEVSSVRAFAQPPVARV